MAVGIIFANLSLAGASRAQTVQEPENGLDQPLRSPSVEEPLLPQTELEPAEELLPEGETVAPVEGATIADIQVRFVDEDGQPT
ncbi:MAG: hypothetical protein HC832_07165, partial [Leptolyngbyaceae cyanobacterium RM1_405_57]|nr:hypothetical protein [Leptolyngbyaceae cyanobacterium RM1_405_57]